MLEIWPQTCDNVSVSVDRRRRERLALARHPTVDDINERYICDVLHRPAGLSVAALVLGLQLDDLFVEHGLGAALIALDRQAGREPLLMRLARAVRDAGGDVKPVALGLQRSGHAGWFAFDVSDLLSD